jgi:ribose 5-phosphate isomerase B
MIRRLGSHVGRRVVFGYDRYLLPELAGYLELLRAHGDVVEAVDADNLHYLSSAQLACEQVQSDPEAFGVLICGTGMGMSIAANKFRGIYAARCMSNEDAELSRAINNANVVCLAARSGFSENRQIIDTFVRTTYTGRKLEQLETIAHFELEASPAPSVPIAAVLRDVRRTA